MQAILATVLDVCSLAFRVILIDKPGSDEPLIMSLAVADFFMGVYLFVFITVDLLYHHNTF